MARIGAVLLLLLALIAPLAPRPARACTCAPVEAAQVPSWLSNHDAVVIAEVKTVHPHPNPGSRFAVDVAVLTQFKGTGQRTLRVTTSNLGASCGYGGLGRVGTTHLLLLGRAPDGSYATSMCSAWPYEASAANPLYSQILRPIVEELTRLTERELIHFDTTEPTVTLKSNGMGGSLIAATATGMGAALVLIVAVDTRMRRRQTAPDDRSDVMSSQE
jgi:hypothetical protein